MSPTTCLITRPQQRWYGSWTLAAAVATAVTVLGVTPLFLANQAAMAVGCTIGVAAACRIPSWVAPVQGATWAGAWIAAALALAAAARAAKSGQRPSVARLAILAALICTAAVILVTLRYNAADATLALPPPD